MRQNILMFGLLMCQIFWNCMDQCLMTTYPGPWFNFFFWPSYLRNGICYSGKMTSLYWIKTPASYDLSERCQMVQSHYISAINCSKHHQFRISWREHFCWNSGCYSGVETRVQAPHSISSGIQSWVGWAFVLFSGYVIKGSQLGCQL